MTIAVLFKWAANPQEAVVGDDGTVDWSRARRALSDYDPSAFELARTVGDVTGADLVGLSVGPADLASTLVKKGVMSRGLDRGLVVADDATASWNATDIARALADLVARVGDVNLVLAGETSVDEGAGVVPALVASFLGWPCLLGVSSVGQSDDGWTVIQAVTGGERTVAVSGPVVVSVAAEAVVARTPSIKDVLAAAKKPFDVAVGGVPQPADRVEVTGRARPASAGRQARVFDGEDAVAQLVSALRADGIV